MVTVFLCDDNQSMVEKYSEWIKETANKNGINITLSTFESGEAMIFQLLDNPNQADVIYLDILMNAMNGIETAKKLRSLGCNSEIVFLTTSEDYVFEAFDISPVQYLIKESTLPEQFEEVFLRAVTLSEKKDTEMFVCESKNARKVIPLKDISHFEIYKRLVSVHFQEEESFEFYGTMEQLEKQLAGKDFVRVHRSYMVNLQYIRKFQRMSLILKTGEVIPIGGTYSKLVNQTFSDYISRLSIYR